MRVLSIAPILPYPPNQGWRVRTWHLLRSLSEAAHVTLLTWAPAGEPAGHVEHVAALVDDLRLGRLEPVDVGPAARARRLARFLAGGRPPFVQAMLEERESSLAALVEGLADPFDVIVFEEEALTALRLPLRSASRVVHRLEAFERALREVRRASPMGRARARVEARAWRRFDAQVMEGMSLAVATSPEVATELAERSRATPSRVVLNGVELREMRTPPARGRDVAFVGTMDYPPNVDAAVWLASELWPAMRPRLPGARLRLVGRDPAPAVRRLAGPDIDVTGEVPDIAESCDGVRVGIVPLRAGMGIKNKTLDFMSMGIPVVSTRAGAEGIAATADDGLVVADHTQTIVDATVSLMSDDGAVARLGEAARAYVAHHHSWKRIGEDYVALLTEVALSATRAR
jgi:glycosyltransferase involved in cell wall biosynthesis